MKAKHLRNQANRSASGRHKNVIQARGKQDEREFLEDIQELFRRQKAVYDIENTQVMKQRIAYDFYNRFYVSGSGENSFLKLDDEADTFDECKGAVVPIEEFLEMLTINNSDTRNNTISIIGDVGTGKTAFINWLISTQFKSLVDAEKLWFIRLDLEDIGAGNFIDINTLVFRLLTKLYRILNKESSLISNQVDVAGKILSQIEELFPDFSTGSFLSEESTPGRNFVLSQFQSPDMRSVIRATHMLREVFQLVEANDNGRRFLLIIDNIDFICHTHDRFQFRRDFNTQFPHILQRYNEFILNFAQDAPLGNLSANVLLVMRPDSRRLLGNNFAISTKNALPNRHHMTIFLGGPGWKDVTKGRNSLLKHIADYPEKSGKRDRFLEMASKIEKELSLADLPNREGKRIPLIEHLQGMANDELRSLMYFLSIYAWINAGHEVSSPTRVIETPPVAIIAFILFGKIMYSQKETRFPNIYMINPFNPFDEIREREVDDTQSQMNFHIEYEDSYWLKRLLLHFLDIDGGRTMQQIEFYFHADGRGYSKELIEECLGILAEYATGNCLRVNRELYERGPSIDFPLVVSSIKLNFRGKHCIDELFDTFAYLQLIVEDPMLPLPRSILSELAFSTADDMDLDYSYLTGGPDEYFEKSIRMINLKAKQVLLMLEVLQLSWKIENVKYPAVFDNLRLDTRLPDPKRIRESVIKEIRSLKRSFSNRINIDSAITAAQENREQIGKDLQAIFELTDDQRTEFEQSIQE